MVAGWGGVDQRRMPARIDVPAEPGAAVPSGEPLEVWDDVVAVGPTWRPRPGHAAFPPGA
jgi:hypothetical protein